MPETQNLHGSAGQFIVFEGIDGTGKSTQISLLAAALRLCNYQVVETFEPTHGEYGQKIRSLYSKRKTISPSEELELFVNDRRQHVREVILPSLVSGKLVLCDRYYLSTAAYQGAAGLDPAEIIARHSFAPTPDLALIIELDPADCIRRITDNRGDTLNDFEQLESLQKVDGIFREMKLPYIRRINGSVSQQEVHLQVLHHVDSLLSLTEQPGFT